MFCTLLIVDIWGVKIVDDVLVGVTKADETAVPPISRTIDNPLLMIISLFCCGYAAATTEMKGEEEESVNNDKWQKNVLKEDMRYPWQKDTFVDEAQKKEVIMALSYA